MILYAQSQNSKRILPLHSLYLLQCSLCGAILDLRWQITRVLRKKLHVISTSLFHSF